jgi:hypothetical protein
MYTVLIALVIGLFVALLFLQLYFRIRVLKVYKALVRDRVQFGALELFNKEKREEVKRRYPNQALEIQTFSDYLHYSIRMATVLIFLITAFGAVLMWYR